MGSWGGHVALAQPTLWAIPVRKAPGALVEPIDTAAPTAATVALATAARVAAVSTPVAAASILLAQGDILSVQGGCGGMWACRVL